MRANFLTVSSSILFASLVACGGGSANSTAATPVASVVGDASAPPAPSTASASPDSDKVTWKKDASAKNCHTAKPVGDFTTAVTGMAQACVGTSMKQLGAATTGTGEASTASMVTTIPLKAKANHCYRV